MKETIGEPCLHISWEIDPECIAVLKKNFPSAHHRGDFMTEDFAELNQLIHNFDPPSEKIVLLTSAPPCPDFSQICPDAPGKEGQEGRKFVEFCKFADTLQQQLQHPIQLRLCENVVFQDRGEISYFEKALRCSAIVVDSSDFGLVSRPRLFWTDIPWDQKLEHPTTGKPLRWSKYHKLPQLHVDEGYMEVQQLEMDGYSLHPKVVDHSMVLPCFTTPSPTDAGRSAPKRMKGRIEPEAKTRWLQDSRTYAPWHYSETAMARSPEGTLVTLPISLKEQLHGLPKNFTDAEGVTNRSRHRMIANGWHIGVIKFLLLLLVQPITSEVVGPPKRSTLQWVLEQVSCHPPCMGLGLWEPKPNCIPPAAGEMHHWELSKSAVHPLLQAAHLSPGLHQAVHLCKRWAHDIARIRTEVVEEISELVTDQAETTALWWRQLPQHVANVYHDREHNQLTQIPIFTSLLVQAGYSADDPLFQDLSTGFATIGQLHGGTGWLPRCDNKYQHPIDEETFQRLNRSHVTDRLRHYRVDEHWKPMLDELRTELELGRLEGPFRSPDWWPKKAIGLEGHALQPTPPGTMTAAFCFSVCQHTKIRRCEDHRRSFHNATVQVDDVPPHEDISVYTNVARSFMMEGMPTASWGQDLNAAYRQFPVKSTDHTYTILCCPDGPVVFRHCALSFGSTASVWSFNRTADAVCFLARRILWTPTCHYVDDFGCVEGETTIQSSFESFENLFRTLGLRMKPSKAQPPAQEQKLLGVLFRTADNDITLQPHPDRVTKIKTLIDGFLSSDQMHPEAAQKLAGKLVFLTSTVFGQLGRGLLTPLYGRAYQTGSRCEKMVLTHALRVALRGILTICQQMTPRIIPTRPTSPIAVIYTDAFFTLGQRVFHASSPDIPSWWDHKKAHRAENGWGFIIRLQDQVFFSHGVVPFNVLQLFCKRRAFIYFLEIIAQIIALTVMKEELPELLISFCDNQAGLSALQRGMGRDENINRLLT